MKSIVTFLIILSLCGVSSWKLITNHIKFHDVQSWPHVEATMIQSDSTSIEVLSAARTSAQKTSLVDAGRVLFSYEVEGQPYQSKLASPDGGGPPDRMLNESWKAFYKPSSPNIAVLSPKPYEGGMWVMLATVSFITLAIYIFATFFIRVGETEEVE